MEEPSRSTSRFFPDNARANLKIPGDMWQGFHTLMRLVITVQLDIGQGRVPLLDEVGHHGADGHGTGVPHHDEIAHHGAVVHGAGVQHLDEVGHHGAIVHGEGVPHLNELCHHGAGLDIMGIVLVDRIFAPMSEFRESLPTRRAQSSLAQLVIRRRGGQTRAA